MSTWKPLISITDDQQIDPDMPGPLAYLDHDRVPRVDDPRGGYFEVAALAACTLPVLDEMPALRVSTYDVVTGQKAVVVVDGFQVVQVVKAMQAWLDGEHEPFVPGLGERVETT